MITLDKTTYKSLLFSNSSKIPDNTLSLLIPNEQVLGFYKTVRDSCVFTNKRVIIVNVQGMTGTKKSFTSLPYSKICAYSIETAGILDLDSILEIHLQDLGTVNFEFLGKNNVVQIVQAISTCIL